MANQSPATSLALLSAPTLCVIAIRFGLPALEEVISQDSVLEFSIHIAALSLGALMLYRFHRVEDHEFHRSQAIRRDCQRLTKVRIGDFGMRNLIAHWKG